jgi:hypothetical protein
LSELCAILNAKSSELGHYLVSEMVALEEELAEDTLRGNHVGAGLVIVTSWLVARGVFSVDELLVIPKPVSV